MSYDLTKLQSPTRGGPNIFTIVGDGGLGKTSLAATFEKPIFIRTEDGTKSLANNKDVKMFDLAKSYNEVMEQIHALLEQEHDFNTLVIDSITQLNVMIESEIVASDPKAVSINTALGGYGAGHSAVSERHRMLRDYVGELSITKGMNVIFIAHCDSETVEKPDCDAYTRYTMRLNRRSISHYSDNVDCVAFLKLKVYFKGEGERKKAINDDTRIITCYSTNNHISKNRLGITEDIVFKEGVNPFIEFIN